VAPLAAEGGVIAGIPVVVLVVVVVAVVAVVAAGALVVGDLVTTPALD
jgi:hypothetical protein